MLNKLVLSRCGDHFHATQNADSNSWQIGYISSARLQVEHKLLQNHASKHLDLQIGLRTNTSKSTVDGSNQITEWTNHLLAKASARAVVEGHEGNGADFGHLLATVVTKPSLRPVLSGSFPEVWMPSHDPWAVAYIRLMKPKKLY